MKILMTGFFLTLSALSHARSGGGPCPVPFVESDFVSTKGVLQTQSPIQSLDVLEQEKALLVRDSHRAIYKLPYAPSQPVLAFKPYLAALQSPLALFQMPHFAPFAEHPWMSKLELIFQSSEKAVAISRRPDGRKARYKVYEFFPDRNLNGRCQTPEMEGLEVSQGAGPDEAFFHRLRDTQLHVYRLNLRSCDWETLFVQTAPESFLDIVHFRRKKATLIISKKYVSWNESLRSIRYQTDIKEVVGLTQGHPLVLARTEKDELKMFLPDRGIITPVLLDVPSFSAHHVQFTTQGSDLFLAGSSISPTRTGIYHFQVKQPLLQ